jgi:hypothetical protein
MQDSQLLFATTYRAPLTTYPALFYPALLAVIGVDRAADFKPMNKRAQRKRRYGGRDETSLKFEVSNLKRMPRDSE